MEHALIYDDMIEAASWMTEKQAEKYLTACSMYSAAGVLPKPPSKPGADAVWYVAFLVSKGRFDAQRQQREAGKKGARIKKENASKRKTP